MHTREHLETVESVMKRTWLHLSYHSDGEVTDLSVSHYAQCSCHGNL